MKLPIFFVCSSVFATLTFALDAKAQLTSSEVEAAQKREDAIVSIPVSFYGKVIDESGNPVAGATAKLDIGSNVNPLSEVSLLSDAEGKFCLKNVHVVDIGGVVFKTGYDTITEPMSPAGGWGLPLNGERFFPTKENPATWVLRKKMPAEPLIEWNAVNMTVPPDGTIVSFNPAFGRKQLGYVGGIEVQTWVDDHDVKSQQPFHWKIRVSVPGGGIQERKDEYLFQAPTAGYGGSDEIDLLPGAGRWTDTWSRNYFLKMPDGKYGRIELSVSARWGFSIKGFLNPTGSQNLEFDRAKRLKPGQV